MLSYQHIYHAGNRADVFKHNALCEALKDLCRRGRAVHYYESHSGRGLYRLDSPEALKTGEAREGWLAVAEDRAALDSLCPEYVSLIARLNEGGKVPLYPGSPLVAANVLRSQDRMHLFELHPQEYTALAKNVSGDRRARPVKADGYEGILALVPPPRNSGFVFVDPSYEVKTEYSQVVKFLRRLLGRWGEARAMIWYPLLPAGYHHAMLESIKMLCPHADRIETAWSDPDHGRGMYGCGLVSIAPPSVQKSK